LEKTTFKTRSEASRQKIKKKIFAYAYNFLSSTFKTRSEASRQKNQKNNFSLRINSQPVDKLKMIEIFFYDA